MPTPKKGRGHPWAGYSVKTERRGFQAWRYRLVNKFHATVFASKPEFRTMMAAREAARAHKKEKEAAEKREEVKKIAGDPCNPMKRKGYGHGPPLL